MTDAHRTSNQRLPLCPQCGGEYDGYCIECERKKQDDWELRSNSSEDIARSCAILRKINRDML